MRSLGPIFWAAIGLFIAFAAYRTVVPSTEPTPHVETVSLEDYSPRCTNARGEPVEFQARQHKVFAEQKLSGLTASQDDKTILYDYDELSKAPAEYRDFVLMAACARNAQAEPREAECTAIKRVRDEQGVSKEKVALIAQHLSPSPGVDDKDARARSLYSCFDARN
jgi:hypothetical protein